MADQNQESCLEELNTFLKMAQHFRVKKLLSEEIKKIESEIVAKQKVAEPKIEEKPGTVRRRQVELHEHAFDESEKFVKIFIPFNKAKISDENVHIEFTSSTSFNVIIADHHGLTDYKFSAVNLRLPINSEKSYIKVKSQDEMIALYLKKEKEGTKWECLTITEKRLKESKSKSLENDKEEEGSKDDPMGGLMNIMKKMYDSGDSEMKRTINKAWSEGQNKSKQNPMF